MKQVLQSILARINHLPNEETIKSILDIAKRWEKRVTADERLEKELNKSFDENVLPAKQYKDGSLKIEYPCVFPHTYEEIVKKFLELYQIPSGFSTKEILIEGTKIGYEAGRKEGYQEGFKKGKELGDAKARCEIADHIDISGQSFSLGQQEHENKWFACENCGEKFFTDPVYNVGSSAKYCSRECRTN